MQFELDYFFCIYDFIQIIHKKVSDGQFTILFNYMMYSQNIKEISYVKQCSKCKFYLFDKYQ